MPHHRPDPHQARRRAALQTLALAVPALLATPAHSTTPARLTPSQTEGPFYPVALPKDADFDLLKNGPLDYRMGQPTWLEGSVTDLQGTPVRGALVEIWHCDHAGHYDHPGDGGKIDKAFQGFGRVAVTRRASTAFARFARWPTAAVHRISTSR